MSSGSAPPWLINMQRYGPPPSYPSLKIPGLNAPIPITYFSSFLFLSFFVSMIILIVDNGVIIQVVGENLQSMR